MAKWQKGQSGNPGGRPKVIAEIRELAQQHAPEAIETLAAIMKDAKAPHAARATAAATILDRGYGKAMQEIKTSGIGTGSWVDFLSRVNELEKTQEAERKAAQAPTASADEPEAQNVH